MVKVIGRFLGMLAVGAACCLAADEKQAPDAASLLCPAVKGEKKGEQKKIAAFAKRLQTADKGIDAADKTGQTLLMEAAALDNRLAVAYLIALGADTDRADKGGKTALDYAQSPSIRSLISVCKQSSETVTHEGRQRIAREMGLDDAKVRLERVKKLLAGQDHLSELATVLKIGVELDAEDIPPLHTVDGLTPESLALLVRRGYSINTPDKDKILLPGDMDTARLALALGLKPSAEAQFAAALISNDLKTAKTMLKQDPELASAPCGREPSPLYMAPSAEMLQTLIDAGAKVQDSPRLLVVLSSLGRLDAPMAQLLIQAGLSPMDGEKASALHYAAALGKTSLVKLLLENKADPNATDENGDTPLLFLLRRQAKLNPASLGLPDTIKALIKGGANPKTKAEDGQNALQLAKSLGRDDLAKVIKSASK